VDLSASIVPSFKAQTSANPPIDFSRAIEQGDSMALPWLVSYIVLGWCIRVAMIPVILRREFAPGASIAWLGVVFLHPYIGLGIYLTIGQNRLGLHRVERHREIVDKYRPAVRSAGAVADRRPSELPHDYEPMVLQAQKISGMPIVSGNSIEFLGNVPQMIDRLLADISAAKSHVQLLYYIFASDAVGTRIADAVIDAAGRGVLCKVLVDAVASRSFFRNKGLARRFRAHGVAVAAAMPVGSIRRELPRMDLRNHRKLCVIDGHIAYMGSHNLIEPDYGGRRGAPWIDVTGRFTGPIVTELATIFAEDWAFESNEELEPPSLSGSTKLDQGIPMQIVPTGPTAPAESYRRLFLAAIQCARSRAIITTPYFAPDEPTLVALIMAADRGVNVTLILPQRPDHLFTAAAGRAHFARLLQAGVSIHLYRPGLLHSKTMTIDDAFALFGSANLDVRSFNLNFELSALLYGRDATERLRSIQLQYLADSTLIKSLEWTARPQIHRYVESALSLLSPLL
jgi:cardiolipin synthase